MKFSTILMALGFATAAIAASTTETSTSAAPSVSLTPTQLCLNSCALGDVTCQAECMGVPSPDAAAVNATTECAGKCEQGVSFLSHCHTAIIQSANEPPGRIRRGHPEILRLCPGLHQV